MNTRFKWLFLLFLLAAPAFAQNVRVDNVAFSSVQGFPFLAGATITICTAAGTGVPCTPTVSGTCLSISDATCNQSATLTSDAFGNYGFWIQPGSYTYTITKAGFGGFGPKALTLAVPSVGNGPGTFTNLTVSGTGTLATVDKWCYVGDIISATEIGSQINTCYTNLAPGGRIHVIPKTGGGCYAATALVNFNTQGKPVIFEGDGVISTCIKWGSLGSGQVAINFDNALTNDGYGSWGEGIRDIDLRGPGLCVPGDPTSNLGIGIQVGHSSAGFPELIGFTQERTRVCGFLQNWQDNPNDTLSFAARILNNVFISCASVANSANFKFNHSAENTELDNNIFTSFCTGNVANPNDVVLSSNTDMHLKGNSFDGSQLVLGTSGGGQYISKSNHYEMGPGVTNATATVPITIASGQFGSLADTFLYDPNTVGTPSISAGGISGITEASNTVTVTTTAVCTFVTGQGVLIAGVTGVTAYNGSWVVLTPGCNGGSSFTYTNPTSGLGAGTVTNATAGTIPSSFIGCTSTSTCSIRGQILSKSFITLPSFLSGSGSGLDYENAQGIEPATNGFQVAVTGTAPRFSIGANGDINTQGRLCANSVQPGSCATFSAPGGITTATGTDSGQITLGSDGNIFFQRITATNLMRINQFGAPLSFPGQGGGLTDTLVARTTTDTLTNKTLNVPLTSGTGLQIFNTTTTCTTGAAVGATCTTANISLPVAEADTSYRVSCTGKGLTAVPVVIATANVSASQFTITIAALTAVAASFASYDCIAGHN